MKTMKVRELNQESINKILEFWDKTDQADQECNLWNGICSACYESHDFLSDNEIDYLYSLKYKIGRRILKRILTHNAEITGSPKASPG